MVRHFTRRSGYIRPNYTHGDRQRRQSSSGAATAAVLVPLALIAGGFMLWKRSQVQVVVPVSGAMPGMGDLGFSLKKAMKKVTSKVQKVTDSKVLRPALAVTTFGMSEMTRAATNFATDPSKEFKRINPIRQMSFDPLLKNSPLVRKLRPKGQKQDTTPAAPGQQVIYQDQYGNVITQAQYEAAMAAQSGVSYTNIVTPEGDPYGTPSPSSSGGSSGGGGGGSPSYDLGPEAPAATQQYAAASADAPAPAESKFNPLIAVGTLIAVPVIMGLTGGK